jgi:hypothetical protein
MGTMNPDPAAPEAAADRPEPAPPAPSDEAATVPAEMSADRVATTDEGQADG